MYEFSKHAIRIPCHSCATTFSIERPLDRYRPTINVRDGDQMRECNSHENYVCQRCLAKQHHTVATAAAQGS